MPPESPTVAVFIDWQNVYQAARNAFGMATFGQQAWPNEYGNFSPYQLARSLQLGTAVEPQQSSSASKCTGACCRPLVTRWDSRPTAGRLRHGPTRVLLWSPCYGHFATRNLAGIKGLHKRKAWT